MCTFIEKIMKTFISTQIRAARVQYPFDDGHRRANNDSVSDRLV